VVVGNMEEYERLIEVIFEEYGIPCFLDKKVDVSNHPLVRLILSMLDIFNENWSYETVFRYLKTGLTGLDKNCVDRLENYVLACGIRGNLWTNDQEWNMSLELIPEEQKSESQIEILKDINRTRTEITSPLIEFRKKAKEKKKTSEICSALYDFLCSTGVPDRIEGYIEEFNQNGKLSLANEYGQVWNIVMEVFDQIVEVMGEETLSLEKFTNTLKVGFDEYKIGLIPASLDQVLVGNVERSRNHEVKAVYILGVNDGVFPSAGLEEGVLTDLDRMVLNKAGVELASDTRTKTMDEQYLVYRALTTAGRYLRLSWPIADQEGRTLRPSIIVSRLRKLFPKIAETSDLVKSDFELEDQELLTGKYPAFKQMVSVLRQRADGKEIGKLWSEAYHWFANQEEWREKCQALRSTFLYKNIAERVSKDKIISLYGDPSYSSVSRLEKYTACPFAFYVQYGLGARERKVYRLSPPDVGTFMHAVIERFSREIVEQNISWREFDRQWCAEKVSEIVENMLEKMQGLGIAGSKRYTALTLRLKRVITRAVWLIAEHIRRGSFEPIGYEIGFGDKEKFPPITIELESGQKVNLIGRIDRVDALKTEENTYLRIIDYKSGRKDFKLSDVYYGLQIQLITYLDALWSNEEKNKNGSVKPGGLLYFHIDDPLIKQNGKISEEEIEKAIMKQLKMKGLLLADVKLIREMDHTIGQEEDKDYGSSMIIPARINKGDVLGRSSVATEVQYKKMRKYVRRLLKGMCDEIVKGNVAIQPYKKKEITSCAYCKFSPICQFDSARKENNYKLIFDQENAEVWKLMAEDKDDK
ncbi:MAG: helicase-exonuclease AddAB subunit AddB, partial [Eubacteriales bacterium]